MVLQRYLRNERLVKGQAGSSKNDPGFNSNSRSRFKDAMCILRERGKSIACEHEHKLFTGNNRLIFSGTACGVLLYYPVSVLKNCLPDVSGWLNASTASMIIENAIVKTHDFFHFFRHHCFLLGRQYVVYTTREGWFVHVAPLFRMHKNKFLYMMYQGVWFFHAMMHLWCHALGPNVTRQRTACKHQILLNMSTTYTYFCWIMVDSSIWPVGPHFFLLRKLLFNEA